MCSSDLVRPQTGHGGSAGRCADRLTDVGVLKGHGLTGQLVQVGRLNPGVAIDRHRIGPLFVRPEKQEVWFRDSWLRGEARRDSGGCASNFQEFTAVHLRLLAITSVSGGDFSKNDEMIGTESVVGLQQKELNGVGHGGGAIIQSGSSARRTGDDGGRPIRMQGHGSMKSRGGLVVMVEVVNSGKTWVAETKTGNIDFMD